MQEFIWPIRVYYEDTDAGGVVYYANYLKFFERARSEWLNHLELDQSDLLKNNIVFVVKNANVEYVTPARLNSQLEIVSTITQITAASITFHQRLYLINEKQVINEKQNVMCDAIIKVACLNLKLFKPCRIPAKVKEVLQRVC